MVKSRTLTILDTGKNVNLSEFSIVGEIQNSAVTLEENKISYKIKHNFAIQPSNHYACHLPKLVENTCPHKNLQVDIYVVVVQSLSHDRLFATPWTVAFQAPLSSTISQFAQIHTHWIADGILPSHPLPPLLLLASVFPSIRDSFQWIKCL